MPTRDEPQRLTPVYETPKPGEETLLVEEEAALVQDDKRFEGTLKVFQAWAPMRLLWHFSAPSTIELRRGDVAVYSKSFNSKGRISVPGQNSALGELDGPVEAGTDHKLDRVTFHLSDYPELYGGHDYHEEVLVDGKRKSIRWSEVVLKTGGWQIRLQPHRDIAALRKKARSSQQVVLSGVGEICKEDVSQFKKKEVRSILKALRFFLSFAFADWSPPLLVVGSNEVADKSWQMWANYDILPRSSLGGWLDEQHGQCLADAFPGFMRVWGNTKWQEPMQFAVDWLIEASRTKGAAGGIAFGQIPLEMLAWLVFVDDKEVVPEPEFDRLSAASKLQMLLDYCEVPFEVPEGLEMLTVLSQKTKYTSGPQLATKVRNTIIHPNRRDREALPSWDKAHSTRSGTVLWEARQLFKWYTTLVLLRLIGYSGSYVSRLTFRKLNDLQQVPWARKRRDLR